MFAVTDHHGKNLCVYTRLDFCLIFISGMLNQGLDIRLIDGMSIQNEDTTLTGLALRAELQPYVPYRI
jgi:hypothetical protein